MKTKTELLAVGLAALVALSAGCAPAGRPGGDSPAARSGEQAQSRSLTIAFRFEPPDLAAKISDAAGSGTIKPIFNAALAITDPRGNPRPQLAEALPQLDTENWRVFPDGRMESVHRLRSNLTWHDGIPLTAEDFVFAWRVYSTPGLGVFTPRPQDQMEEVVALDPRTALIRWRSPYADADILGGFPPLPGHILGEAFTRLREDPSTKDALLSHSFWSTDYVGAGAYRLGRWEPGVLIEGIAFEGYALGRPKIDRLIGRIIADENTALANMLSETVHYANDYALRFEQAMVLKREWAAGNRGVVILKPGTLSFAIVQFRPEHLKTPELLDRRVRQALAHALDKQALRDGLFEGEGPIIHTFVSTDESYFEQVEQAVTKYTYDPRHAEQLMLEAGLTRDREGFFANATGERFRPDFQVFAGTVFERGQAIIADTWLRAGIQVQPSVLPAAQVRDNEARNTFSGLGPGAGGNLGSYASQEIATASSRWVGGNRGGWSDADYDRLWEAYNRTLDREGRTQQVVQMAKLVSDQVPVVVFYFNFSVNPHLSNLRGPQGSFWNVHEWDLTN